MSKRVSANLPRLMKGVARLSSSITLTTDVSLVRIATIFLDVHICLLFARGFARLIMDVRTMFVKI